MKLLRSVMNTAALQQGTVAAIGNFDGVHRGHQHVLAAVLAKAKTDALAALVIIFEPQTREYFLKENSPPRLSGLREKIQVFQELGIDYVCCMRFDERMARMDAVAFAESIIFSKLQVKHLFVGDDFRFGCERVGDVVLLKTLGQTHHVSVVSCPDFMIDGQRVSSTRVRQALKADSLDEASKLLGRPYRLCGRVMYGEGMGRQWDVPTANLNIPQVALPVHGVFCVQVRTPDGQLYNGIANIGRRPTVGGLRLVLEVHLFDFSGNLYGQRISVYFLHKLRNEIFFSSKSDLIAQIHQDVAIAQRYFL